jgi:hypothetical protein
MLDIIEPLARAGFAIHWLHKKSKRPIGNDWSDKPVASLKALRESYEKGNNVGVRLGKWSKVDDYYLHVIDLDIHDEDEAEEALDRLGKMFPEWETYPIVQSGSGGESRHIYILTDKPFASRKLAVSGNKFKDDKGTTHYTWEIEFYGTGKQVVMPPSIHPDSGKAYRWLREFDLDDVALGLGPIVPSDPLLVLSIGQARSRNDTLQILLFPESRQSQVPHDAIGPSRSATDRTRRRDGQSRRRRLV